MLKISQLLFKVRRKLLFFIWKIKCVFQANRVDRFILSDGSCFDYPLKSVIGFSLSSGGFETAEVEFMRRSLKPGNVVFDIGANGGLFTVIAAKQVGASGHVYAFEPGQRELKLLYQNISINELTNVTVIERAVADKSGTAKFAVSHDGALSSLAKTAHPMQHIEKWLTVDIISLDDFVKESGIQKVDFMKIDVEGAEKLVFAGAKNILASKSEITIMFEASDLNASGFGYSVHEFLDELFQLKLSLYYLNKTGELSKISKYNSKLGRDIYNFVALKIEEN